MILVRAQQGCIAVTGHAGHGPPGHDLVCAAVSTLTQTLISAIDDLTDDKLKSDIQPGKVVIGYRDLSAHGRLLIDSFFVGVNGVAEAYPECVKIVSPGGATKP